MLNERRFAPLFWTQFFSAFGDNVLKNALVFVILHQMGARGEALVTLAGGVFIAPFVFMSGLGGQLADRFDKAAMTRALKTAELGVALLAAIGFMANSVAILFVALFLYGVIAALFGPVKYGILPDILRPQELGAGNALIEGATFLAILLGTIAGGLTAADGTNASTPAIAIVALAALCWATSRFIPAQAPAAPNLAIDRNILRSTAVLVRMLSADRSLWRTGVLVSFFWLVGAVVLSLLPPLVKSHLGASDESVTVFLAVFAIAIAVGSAGGAALMQGRIDLRSLPWAALAMAAFALDASLSLPARIGDMASRPLAQLLLDPASWRAVIDLGGLAIAGGIFVVPTFAALQAWAPRANRSRMIAAVNVLSALFMVGGAVVVGALQASGVSLNALFGLVAAGCAGCAAWVFTMRADFSSRAAEKPPLSRDLSSA